MATERKQTSSLLQKITAVEPMSPEEAKKVLLSEIGYVQDELLKKELETGYNLDEAQQQKLAQFKELVQDIAAKLTENKALTLDSVQKFVHSLEQCLNWQDCSPSLKNQSYLVRGRMHKFHEEMVNLKNAMAGQMVKIETNSEHLSIGAMVAELKNAAQEDKDTAALTKLNDYEKQHNYTAETFKTLASDLQQTVKDKPESTFAHILKNAPDFVKQLLHFHKASNLSTRMSRGG